MPSIQPLWFELPRALEREGPRGKQLERLALQVTRSDHPSTDD
jgi:hypothetical protein